MSNRQIKVNCLILPLVISSIIISGCTTISSKTSSGSEANAILLEKDKKITALNASLQEEREARNRLEEERKTQVTASGKQPLITSEPGLLPPEAKAGECYARVFTAPKYQTETLTIRNKDASGRIEIIPAKYETVEERVLIKEASERIEVVPATYEWVTEQVLIAPATERIEVVPAVYKTEIEKVLDKPEHTIWKKGTGPITKIDAATGEIMCLVTIPASYKTVTKKVLVSDAATRVIAVPAQYKAIKKRMVKSTPTTRTITIPAEYKIVKTRKLVEPEKTRRLPVDAEYTTVTKSYKVAEGKMEWASVLCKTNMNPQIGLDLQKSLKAAGYNPGKLDGIIGKQTMAAVTSYQRAKGLRTGGLTMETLNSLGVKLADIK